MTTEYTHVSSDYSPGWYEEGYPDDPYSSGTIAGVGDITTLITGELADRVRRRAGKSGNVYIVEHHWDIGYCVTCSDEQIDFKVLVGAEGEEVFTTLYYDSGDGVRGPQEVNNISQFNDWLNEKED